jgi:hypothetical protein
MSQHAGLPALIERRYSGERACFFKLTHYRLFVLLSHAVRTMLLSLLLSDSFLDCLPRGGRILPRRILMQLL